MKRSIFLRLFIFFDITCYFALLILSICGVIFPFYETWFSYALIFLSFLLFPRFIFYGVDTNMWIGSLLLLSGTYGIIAHFYSIYWLYSLAAYILCFGIASFIMFMFFRQIFHLKIFTFALLFAIIICIYASGLISLWLFISLISLTFILASTFAVKAILSNTRKV